MKLFIGCSGWQYADWQEKFYPQSIAKTRWFEYYCEQFNTVEINYTFYHFPSESTVKRWQQQVKKGFYYSLKANRAITHYKKFHATQRMINDFFHQANYLEDKLGCVLWQLPATLSYTAATLKNIIQQLDPSKCNVLECRHPSWWCDDVYKTLAKANIIFCSIDAPNLPNDLIKTNGCIYLRFHGYKNWYQDNYSKQRLATWAEKIKRSKAKTAWIYFNNDYNAYAPKNAQVLRKLLG